jgi:hypothetical protein
MNQVGELQIKMEDKYYNEWIFEQFRQVLNLPSEIVSDESDDERLMLVINFSFNQLMNIFLESHQLSVSSATITML